MIIYVYEVYEGFIETILYKYSYSCRRGMLTEEARLVPPELATPCLGGHIVSSHKFNSNKFESRVLIPISKDSNSKVNQHVFLRRCMHAIMHPFAHKHASTRSRQMKTFTARLIFGGDIDDNARMIQTFFATARHLSYTMFAILLLYWHYAVFCMHAILLLY